MPHIIEPPNPAQIASSIKQEMFWWRCVLGGLCVIVIGAVGWMTNTINEHGTALGSLSAIPQAVSTLQTNTSELGTQVAALSATSGNLTQSADKISGLELQLKSLETVPARMKDVEQSIGDLTSSVLAMKASSDETSKKVDALALNHDDSVSSYVQLRVELKDPEIRESEVTFNFPETTEILRTLDNRKLLVHSILIQSTDPKTTLPAFAALAKVDVKYTLSVGILTAEPKEFVDFVKSNRTFADIVLASHERP